MDPHLELKPHRRKNLYNTRNEEAQNEDSKRSRISECSEIDTNTTLQANRPRRQRDHRKNIQERSTSMVPPAWMLGQLLEEDMTCDYLIRSFTLTLVH